MTELYINRDVVPNDTVQRLYKDILEEAVPGPRDNFHKDLLVINGDAGASFRSNDDGMTKAEHY